MGDTTDGHPLNTTTEINADHDNLQPVLDEIAVFAIMAYLAEHVFDGGGSLAGAGAMWQEKVNGTFAPYLGMTSPDGFDWELAEVVSANQLDITPGTPGVPGTGGTAPASNSVASASLATTLNSLLGRASQLHGNTDTFFEATVGPAVALAAEQNLWKQARDNVVRVSQDADIAMEVAMPDEGSSLSTELLIGAGLAGIGATTASSLVGQASPGSSSSVPLGADNPEQVLINVSDALDQVRRDVDEQESEIVTFIDSLLVATFDDSNFDLRSPGLLRDDRASDVLDTSKTLLSDHEVHNITDAWLPDVADALLHSGSTRSEPSQGHGDRTGGPGIGASGP